MGRKNKEGKMTQQQAIRILMLSPFYYKLTPDERNRLIKEYCRHFPAPIPQKDAELKIEQPR